MPQAVRRCAGDTTVAEGFCVSQAADPDITRILTAAAEGDGTATNRLFPLVYDELRNLARGRLRHGPAGQSLNATALVHEAYLRLIGKTDQKWAGRAHFFAVAGRAMRDILVERARRRRAQKRGGDRQRLDADEAEPWCGPPDEDVLAVHEALAQLEQEDSRKGEIVNLRYFARFTTDETADALGVSVATVEREWRYIRAWLARALKSPTPPAE